MTFATISRMHGVQAVDSGLFHDSGGSSRKMLWHSWQTYLCGFDSGQFDYVSFVSKPNKNQQKFSEVRFLLVAARCSLHTTNSEYWIRAFGTKAIAM